MHKNQYFFCARRRKKIKTKNSFKNTSDFENGICLYISEMAKAKKKFNTEMGGGIMSSSLSDEEQQIKLAGFISFSRIALKNISRNKKGKINREKIKEAKVKSILQSISDLCIQDEIYKNEFVITDARGHSGIITVEWLYKAIVSLSDTQREVILLRYWYGMLIGDIAKIQNVSERTVYTRKQQAFKHIKNYYERTRKNED